MPEPNSDQLALIAQADLDRLVRMVIAPVLEKLRPGPVSPGEVTNDLNVFLDRAKAHTHNALCEEARRAFAMTIGGTFERHVRLWLAKCAPGQTAAIQTANLPALLDLIQQIKGVDIRALSRFSDLEELWELTSAFRHGDGRAATRLAAMAPNLWSGAVDTGIEGAVIGDADLTRYYLAAMVFWGELGATPPLGVR